MFTSLRTVFSLFTRYSTLIKYVLLFLLVLGALFKGYLYYSEHEQLKVDKDKLTIELKTTKLELSKAVLTAKQNADLLLKEKENNKEEQKSLEEKHKEDLKKKKSFTIIKERTYYEKDSDYIAPVLGNTIDRLFNKTRTTN